MLSRTISGAKLRRVREERCLKVAAVAQAAGCSPWTIYKIEQGRSQPSASLYAGLKDALAVDDEALTTEPSGNAA